MKKYIGILFGIISCCLLSCTDDSWVEHKAGVNGSLPVEFVVELPQNDPFTRAAEYDDALSCFQDGNIIQVIARFYKDGKEGSSTSEDYNNPVTCFLTYQKEEGDPVGKWVNTTDVPFVWPWDADYGTFSAFYYPKIDGLLGTEGADRTFLLDSITVGTDPLITERTDNVPYGHAVKLQFEHLCTKLILTDLDAAKVGTDARKLRLRSNAGSTTENAFKLSLSDGGTSDFVFDFVRFPETADNVSIEGNVMSETAEGEGGEKSCVFFLPPGDYSHVTLTHRFGRPLLTWDKVNQLEDLVAGKSYTVSLKDLQGNITYEDDDDWWDDSDPIKPGDDTGFDLQTFLNSVANGNAYSYTENGVEIPVLEEIEDDQVVLLKNIDFDNQPFDPEELKHSVKFDGNGHYFTNIRETLFSSIQGTVENLKIGKAEKKDIALTTDEPAAGILAAKATSAVINNIRLEDITMIVTSFNGNPSTVGALVGNASGTVFSEIAVDKITVKIDVATTYPDPTNNTLMVGGLIGQNAVAVGEESRKIEDVSMLDNGSLITVEFSKEVNSGHLYIGGLVGVSAGDIIDCKLRANVDASKANGNWNYTGGLAGSMRGHIGSVTTEHRHIVVEDSYNDGTVKGGICHAYQEELLAIGHSATGGLIGYSLGTDTKNCVVNGTVSSKVTAKTSDTYYTIGGLVGTIRHEEGNPVNVRSNHVYAKVNMETQELDEDFLLFGWLAGVAPSEVEANDGENHNQANATLDAVGRVDNFSPTPSEVP